MKRTCFLMDSTGLLERFGVHSSDHWMAAYVWHVYLNENTFLSDQVLLEILNWLRKSALFPVSYTTLVDAESHIFPNLKRSSIAGIDMVHQPSHTGASETEAYGSFMTLGTWRAPLTCVAKDQLLRRGGGKLSEEMYDHMVQHRIYTVPHNLHDP